MKNKKNKVNKNDEKYIKDKETKKEETEQRKKIIEQQDGKKEEAEQKESSVEEDIEEKEEKKIPFLKKIWYSIGNINKYEKLRKEGLGASIKYFLGLVVILAFILAIIYSVIQVKMSNEVIQYLNDNLPKITFKNNKLSIENGDAIILDNEDIANKLGSVIVINPLIDENEAVKNYSDLATDKHNCMVFLSEEYVIITSKYNSENVSDDTDLNNVEGITISKYSDISSRYISDVDTEYHKEALIASLQNSNSYSYYIAENFVIYFIRLFIEYFMYIILIAILIWLVVKVIGKKKKIEWTLKDSFINVIYASTLSIIVCVIYFIVSYFIKQSISFYDTISILLIFVYIYMLLYKDKKKKRR